jgi:hypothetical protein
VSKMSLSQRGSDFAPHFKTLSYSTPKGSRVEAVRCVRRWPVRSAEVSAGSVHTLEIGSLFSLGITIGTYAAAAGHAAHLPSISSIEDTSISLAALTRLQHRAERANRTVEAELLEVWAPFTAAQKRRVDSRATGSAHFGTARSL